VPHGATARLFVALDPPAQARRALAGWARAAAGAIAGPSTGQGRGAMRLLDAEQLHLTLCFLGARPVEEIGALAAALEGCEAHVGELSLGGPLWLPPRHPRALAVAVGNPDGTLERLAHSVAVALAAAGGWEPERRRFRAHITVARLPGGGRSPRRGAERPGPLPPTPALCFLPGSMSLYRSWLEPSGAIHEPLLSWSLQQPQLSSTPAKGSGSQYSVSVAAESTSVLPAGHRGSEPSAHS